LSLKIKGIAIKNTFLLVSNSYKYLRQALSLGLYVRKEIYIRFLEFEELSWIMLDVINFRQPQTPALVMQVFKDIRIVLLPFR